MASFFYDETLADYGDLRNSTGNCPGYVVGVAENDGGILLQMHKATADLTTDCGYAVFMSIEEAEKFMKGIENAVHRARIKANG